MAEQERQTGWVKGLQEEEGLSGLLTCQWPHAWQPEAQMQSVVQSQQQSQCTGAAQQLLQVGISRSEREHLPAAGWSKQVAAGEQSALQPTQV